MCKNTPFMLFAWFETGDDDDDEDEDEDNEKMRHCLRQR
jgi:hypothetical protein